MESCCRSSCTGWRCETEIKTRRTHPESIRGPLKRPFLTVSKGGSVPVIQSPSPSRCWPVIQSQSSDCNDPDPRPNYATASVRTASAPATFCVRNLELCPPQLHICCRIPTPNSPSKYQFVPKKSCRSRV
jgi:hypothetical protein